MTSTPPAQDYKHAEFLKLFRPVESSHEKVTLALFGLGAIGTIHLKNLLSNNRVNLKYVVEERESRQEEVKSLFGGMSSTVQYVGVSDTESVLSDKDVQGVLITTPTFTHKQIILKALGHKKAVMCEKPVSDNYEDVKECYTKAKQVGVPLFCSFNRRFDPSYGTIARRVQAGEVGKVHVIKSVARDSPMPPVTYLKCCNGVFHDTMVHEFDLICWTLGEFPTRVFATGRANYPEVAAIPDYDTVALQMSFPGNTLGIMDMSRFAAYGYDQRFEVFGPKGMLQANNQHPISVSTFKADGVQDAPIMYHFCSRYEASYVIALNHFIDVLQGKEELMVTPQQVLNISMLATAAGQSAKSGQPVDITYEEI